MATIATFGETMLRISPWDTAERVVHARQYRVEPGGSESNVAIALAALGHHAYHITRLPADELGDLVVAHLRSYGVDINRVARGGERIGSYWTETGLGTRASTVLYDRAGSSFATWAAAELDWRGALADVSWLHVSGITPAVSETAADLQKRGLNAVGTHVSVSMDLNYRSTLWRNVEDGRTAHVREVMSAYCERCDVLLGNESDFGDSLGITPGESSNPAERYRGVAEEVFSRFARVRTVAVSLRQSHSATDNGWSGLLFMRTTSGMDTFQGPTFRLDSIADRVGAGDAFAAGVLHGLLSFPEAAQQVVDFAVSLGALKHSVRGDMAAFPEAAVWHALQTEGAGRIQR
jgi:2-dehydro-3-deoxygluconokinase